MLTLARAQVRPHTHDQADPAALLLAFPIGTGPEHRELLLTLEQFDLVLALGAHPSGPVAPLDASGRAPTMPTADLLRFLDGHAAASRRHVAASLASPEEFAHASIRDALTALAAGGPGPHKARAPRAVQGMRKGAAR